VETAGKLVAAVAALVVGQIDEPTVTVAVPEEGEDDEEDDDGDEDVDGLDGGSA